MIITKIRLQEEFPMASTSDSWPLSVFDFHLNSSAGENGYLLKPSDGLGPPEITEIVDGFDIYGVPVLDDVAEKREIVLRIGLQPGIGQSYSSLRDDIYRLLSRTMLLKLMNDSIVLGQTIGFIRRVEPVHFSTKPEVQITIQCQEGEFSAPVAIPIPFSDLDATHPVINYKEGTAPTGLDLAFIVTDDVSGFSIFDHSRVRGLSSSPVSTLFELTYPLLVDDEISISTHHGGRRITLVRAATTYDLGGYINPGAVWPKLYPRVNTFGWDLTDTWMEWVSASYIPKHWGV